jgi:hypothetical protein
VLNRFFSVLGVIQPPRSANRYGSQLYCGCEQVGSHLDVRRALELLEELQELRGVPIDLLAPCLTLGGQQLVLQARSEHYPAFFERLSKAADLARPCFIVDGTGPAPV